MSSLNSSLLTFSHDLADAVERAGRSVVAINAGQRRSSSGVHWQPGVIVTAEHNLKRDEEIIIALPHSTPISATLIGRDPTTDLAVLRFEGVELPTVEIADASQLKVGHFVLAIARHNDDLSASFGVLSALSGSWRTWSGGEIDQFIRPDLSFYPGFSGGPLVDVQGRVVGINTSGPRRMVLTIPTITVNRVVSQLIEKGHISRGYLGVSLQPVHLPDTLKATLNLPGSGGVIVVNVEAGGPADHSGVLIGDVLVALDGIPVSDTGELLALLGPERVGKTVGATIVRGGTLTELTIAVGERSRQEG